VPVAMFPAVGVSPPAVVASPSLEGDVGLVSSTA
jgi:hypothetical protein